VIGIDCKVKILSQPGQVGKQLENILVNTGPTVTLLPGKQMGIYSNPLAVI
jgi:hypothetical protein